MDKIMNVDQAENNDIWNKMKLEIGHGGESK